MICDEGIELLDKKGKYLEDFDEILNFIRENTIDDYSMLKDVLDILADAAIK